MKKNKLKSAYLELKRMKETATNNIMRGRDFEFLINELMDLENILLKTSYHTSDNKSEQIDGVIKIDNRIILLEVKWVEKSLAASTLYAFIGKVENKLVGTLGLFISKNQLTDNFIDSLSRGRKKCVLIIHGDDVDYLFENSFPITSFLEYYINRLSYDNIDYLSIRDYNKNRKNIDNLKTAEKSLQASSDEFNNFLSKILITSKLDEHIIYSKLNQINETSKGQVMEYLLKKYPEYNEAYGDFFSKDYNKLNNISTTIKLLLKDDDVIVDTHTLYFNLFKKTYSYYYLRDLFWNSYFKYFSKFKDKNGFYDALYKSINKNLGDYNIENLLTMRIKEFYDKFTEKQKNNILNIYIKFLISDRKDGYEQKDFAKKIIINNKSPENLKYLDYWLNSEIEKEILDFDITETDISSTYNSFSRRYSVLNNAYELSPNEWKNKIKNIFLTKIRKKIGITSK